MTTERKVERAYAIIQALPVGLAIDSQTLMQRVMDCEPGGYFDAQEADYLESAGNGTFEVFDAGKAGQGANIAFWVRRPA